MKCLRKYKWLKLHGASAGRQRHHAILLPPSILGGLSIASLVLILFLTKGVQNGAFEALS